MTRAEQYRIKRATGVWAFRAYCTLSYIFLLSPMVVVIGTSLNGPKGTTDASFQFPPENVSLYWYGRIPEAQIEALALSFALAGIAALGACVLGVPAALGLVRSNLPGKALISTVFRAPLQIPSIVTGIAFLQLFYLIGDLTGFYWQGTLLGLAIGHIFVATPYVVGTVTAILQRFDMRLEEAALIHGATRWRAFRRVTLPVIMPGVYAGALYAFMVSFGDVPIAIFLTAPGFVTYPVELFTALENDFDPSIMASASMVIFLCLIALLAVQKLVGLDTLLRTGGGGGR
ncbi:MAG: ABC transporter permease [Kiloniellales bacterium]|nr:ABC transporter permease [Kiloniellales bacterium]